MFCCCFFLQLRRDVCIFNMITSTQNMAHVDDEQIEDLVERYSQYCEMSSRTIFDAESQSYVVESQLDESENDIPVKLDYQGEFFKCIGLDANVIKQIENQPKAAYEPSTQHELNSQTDVEANLRTYITGNPDWNQNIASKPLDLEAFLNTREYFVTIKPGNNDPITANGNELKTGYSNRCRSFTLGPLPLEIDDVLKISTDCDEAQVWRGYQKIYGQNFKTVMFYGRCKPFGGCVNAERGRNVKLYEIDDGSGMIVVHFPHRDSKYSALSGGIDRLLEEYALAKKEGIAFLGTSNGPKTIKCKQMLDNINVLINVIRKNGSIKQNFFTHGCKVCVIGRVFGHNDGTNHVFAYDMIEDTGKNRDFEIKYKKHLMDTYEMKYLKFKITGEPLDS